MARHAAALLHQVEPIHRHEQAIATGKLDRWERNGNAFYLELSADGAAIEDVVDETSPIQTVSLDEFRAAVLAWRERIEGASQF